MGKKMSKEDLDKFMEHDPNLLMAEVFKIDMFQMLKLAHEVNMDEFIKTDEELHDLGMYVRANMSLPWEAFLQSCMVSYKQYRREKGLFADDKDNALGRVKHVPIEKSINVGFWKLK